MNSNPKEPIATETPIVSDKEKRKSHTLVSLLIHSLNGDRQTHLRQSYFSEKDREECLLSVGDILSNPMFGSEHINFVIDELRGGRVNGCFAKTDLIGILSCATRIERQEIYDRLQLVPGNHNPFEWWFFQIGHNLPDHCPFANSTIELCSKIIRLKSQKEHASLDSQEMLCK